MNRTSPDSERPPASEPVWERPWSVEEIRRSSQNWSLAADAGLLQFLQEFSQQTISRTHEIKKQVDGLIQETKATHCRLHNVFNDFLMLSNTQFIENRVYDEEVEEQVLKAEAEKTEQEKTREQKEVDLIPKVREAVNYGLQVLDSAFEQLDIKAGNSDSEEDDANERVELILEPKDLYIDRPLPYLIGSKLFMEQEDVGLGELSSEEGSVGSNRGSIVDSEEEKEEEESDEDFASRSDNDQNQHTTQMSDEEEDDDGDLFVDSEKEGDDIEDIEENAKSKRPTSFADELAARIKGDISNQLKEEQIDGKLQKTMKEKKERRTPPDEVDNLFGSAPAKKQVSSLQPHSQEKPKPSEQPQKKASALLFSSDEEDQWNITDSHTKLAPDSTSKGWDSRTSQGQEAKAVKKTNLFEEDDDEVDLFAIAKDSQKKTPRTSLLFEDDADSGSSLFGFPPASVPPATMKKESISEVPSLFSDEEENEVPSGVKSMDVKVDNAKVSPEVGNADIANVVKKEGFFTASDQEAVGPSDLFSSSSPLDRGTKGRTKTVLSLFDEEEKVEDQSNTCVPQKEMEKGLRTDGRPKSTGVFQDEELLFSHKLQEDNDPDVDLFSGTKKTRLSVPCGGSLFGDDEDDDLFSSAKTQPVVPEKKGLLKKDHPVSLKSEKTPESTQGSKEKSLWKAETPQDSSGPTPFKSREPSSRIRKIQANLAINPAALLPPVALQTPGTKPLSSELAFPSSEPGRSHVLERVPTLPGSEETGVSFDLPAQADTLHSANKSRVKVRGKRRPQTRAARRLAAQESSESEDLSVSRGPVAQLANSSVLPNGHQPHLQPNMASGEMSSEEAVAPAAPPWESGPALSVVDKSFSVTSLPQTGNEADLSDAGDIFPQSIGSQSMEGTKVKAAETPAHLSGGSKEKSLVFPILSEASSADDLFQTVKPRPAKKRSPFPLLEDEDDLFADQKGKKKELKPDSHQDSVSKTQDIFEDDIFATEAVKPFQKKREKERTLEPNLFDDNIDIFADLTVKPREKSKKKVEAKSMFDDDTDDIFSSGLQAKMSKPKSQSAEVTSELRSGDKVSTIFDDPLNAFGSQ
ncbi:WASH complex subunit 2C [Onychomys torridus]|uniref:WASH complex subunit 2C n=1 Tax=Onychomys torridus TaxID=38674 RepID=UPI00167F46BE|nr:WASH complex subunit 2C [Onychomys torridus]